MTYELIVTDQASDFDLELEQLRTKINGQVLASQDRCVDGLLDLLNAAPSRVAHDLIVDILNDVRHLSSVRVDWLEGQLDVLAAALAVETGTFSWR